VIPSFGCFPLCSDFYIGSYFVSQAVSVLVITASTPFSDNSASRELGNCAAYPTYILQYVTGLVQDGRNFICVQSA
jgi:hypothetical protein